MDKDKEKHDYIISLRDLYDPLFDRALKERRTMANVIRQALREYLERKEG